MLLVLVLYGHVRYGSGVDCINMALERGGTLRLDLVLLIISSPLSNKFPKITRKKRRALLNIL